MCDGLDEIREELRRIDARYKDKRDRKEARKALREKRRKEREGLNGVV